MKNDIKIICKKNNNEIKFDIYSSDSIKSGFKFKYFLLFKINKINIEGCKFFEDHFESYRDCKRNGEFVYFYMEKNLNENIYKGRFFQFYKNSCIMKKEYYKNNKKEEKCIKWDRYGNKSLECFYKNDLLEGQCIGF
jgi:antitoxin component YwqK of YwqJK toxin-antitoxin module